MIKELAYLGGKEEAGRHTSNFFFFFYIDDGCWCCCCCTLLVITLAPPSTMIIFLPRTTLYFYSLWWHWEKRRKGMSEDRSKASAWLWVRGSSYSYMKKKLLKRERTYWHAGREVPRKKKRWKGTGEMNDWHVRRRRRRHVCVLGRPAGQNRPISR